MQSKLQIMLAAQAKAKAEAKAEAETLAKEKTIAKEKAKAKKAELIKGIKAFHKSLLKGLKAEEKAEAKKAKTLINNMKKVVKDWEAEEKEKADQKLTEILLRSGSWAAIYGALDGTEKGLARAAKDIIKNIISHIESNNYLVIKLNKKTEFNYLYLKGKGEEVAMSVLHWLYRQEYFSKTCIYHTDFKFDNENNLIYDPRFKELNIYKFATIVAKGIRKYIIKNYINKYSSLNKRNKTYGAKIDTMDVVNKQGAENLENQDSYEIKAIKNDTLKITAKDLKDAEVIEFVNKKGEFKFNLFMDKITEEKGEELGQNDRMFLEALSRGLNSRNSYDFGITSHNYKITRNKLIRKGFLQANKNLYDEIQKYIKNKK